LSTELLAVTVEGQPRVDAVIKALNDQVFLDRILDEGAAVLFNRMRERFLRQVDPDGVPWPPSKAAAKRKASGRGGGTLFASGRLWESLQLYADGPLSRAIGTDVPYGKFHQYGTIHLPRRQFLGFGADDIGYMEQLAVKRITEALA
jgi:phage virion morphogenesis protein